MPHEEITHSFVSVGHTKFLNKDAHMQHGQCLEYNVFQNVANMITAKKKERRKRKKEPQRIGVVAELPQLRWTFTTDLKAFSVSITADGAVMLPYCSGWSGGMIRKKAPSERTFVSCITKG